MMYGRWSSAVLGKGSAGSGAGSGGRSRRCVRRGVRLWAGSVGVRVGELGERGVGTYEGQGLGYREAGLELRPAPVVALFLECLVLISHFFDSLLADPGGHDLSRSVSIVQSFGRWVFGVGALNFAIDILPVMCAKTQPPRDFQIRTFVFVMCFHSSSSSSRKT